MARYIQYLDSVPDKEYAEIWQQYYNYLEPIAKIKNVRLPYIPEYATNNAHMFYLACESIQQRDQMISYLKENGVYAVFHYLSLHKSRYYKQNCNKMYSLHNSDYYTNCVVRLPLYYELRDNDIEYICDVIKRL